MQTFDFRGTNLPLTQAFLNLKEQQQQHQQDFTDNQVSGCDELLLSSRNVAMCVYVGSDGTCISTHPNFNIKIVMDLNHLEAIKIQLKDFFVLSFEICRLKLPYKKIYFFFNASMWVESISFIDFSSFPYNIQSNIWHKIEQEKGSIRIVSRNRYLSIYRYCDFLGSFVNDVCENVEFLDPTALMLKAALARSVDTLDKSLSNDQKTTKPAFF